MKRNTAVMRDVVEHERPRLSAESVTKGIRSTSNPIEVQLKNAKDLIYGGANVFLPKKQEFVLDWLLERLKTDPKSEKSAAIQIELWNLLRDIFLDGGLDTVSLNAYFRRHNFLGLLQDGLEDLLHRSIDDRTEMLIAIEACLDEIYTIDPLITIRPQIEQATLLLGLCLEIVNDLPPGIGINLTLKICQIFRTILHEDRQARKIVKSFSKNCLKQAVIYLSRDPPDAGIECVGSCIQETLFMEENFLDYLKTIEICRTLNKTDTAFDIILKAIPVEEGKHLFDELVGLPLLLKLGLTSLLQKWPEITLEQKSYISAALLSSLDAYSSRSPSSTADGPLSLIHLSIRHLTKLCCLLEVFLECNPPQSDTLTTTLTSLSATCISFLGFTDVSVAKVAWKALALLMTIDFEVVLGLMEQVYPRIHGATLEFLEVLVVTNFKIRNGVEFVKQWTELLRTSEANESGLCHPDILELISKEIGANLSAIQIHELLEYLQETLHDPSTLTSMKLVLSNIKSPEVIENISSYIVDTLGPLVLKKLLSKHPSESLYELFYLLLELSGAFAIGMKNDKVVRKAKRRCQRSPELFPLLCILRLKEVDGVNKKANRRLSEAFQKSLKAAFARMKTNTEHGLEKDTTTTLETMNALIQRWIRLVKDFGSDEIKESFARVLCNLGSQADLCSENSQIAKQCVELQFRFLMSSDVYDSDGLILSFLDVLESDLNVQAVPQNNQIAIVNGNDSDIRQSMSEPNWMRCRNAVTVIARLHLEPTPRSWRSSIFTKLLQLDRAIGSKHVRVPGSEKNKIFLLVSIRYALIRYAETVEKSIIEENTIVDGIFDIYKSLDRIECDELQDISIQLGKTLLRQLAQRQSSRIANVLLYLVNAVTTRSSYKVQSLRPALRAWLAERSGPYFVPNGETLLAINVLQEINVAKGSLSLVAIEEFEKMQLNALVQLRDCLTELLDEAFLDKGLVQATFLLQTLRCLLMASDRKMDLQGLIARFGRAFSFGIRKMNSESNGGRDRIQSCLEDIFEIMCYLNAFDSPVVACAAYISLLKYAFEPKRLQSMYEWFRLLVSNLEPTDYDFLLQEILNTTEENVKAVEAMRVMITAAPEGENYSFMLTKLLFGLTRNLLRATRSDNFVSTLNLIMLILREKPRAVSKWNLDHLIANLTITCSPACPSMIGSATQDDIFISIGSVALAILQLYNKRLTQKYHLVVRMLQVMLHVFVKTTLLAPKQLRDALSRPPPWLATSCSVTSAQLFSRVLITWTSPPSTTWNNMKSREAKQRLTSTTAKTARAVSKHIPGFMMEYVALLAEYPELVIEGPVQKALAPGLYALFNVLGTYEREMCMAALDGPGQGIFKKLWEDWGRFGKFVEK